MALENIRGHSKQVNLLRAAIQHGRIPHAYLFTGLEGVGKRLLAENLAKVLNCQNPIDPEGKLDACNECSACKKIDNKTHPDVQFIEPDGQFIKIDQLRDLFKAVSFKPYEGRWKVFLIDQAETLNPTTANALLKTLEEPTKRTLFILISGRPHLMLPTIISRCQRIRFGAIPYKDLFNILLKKGLKTEDATFYSNIAEGSVGKALSLAGGELKNIAATKLEPLSMFLSKTKFSGPETVEELFELSKELLEEKGQLPLIIDVLRSWYRDLIIWKATSDESLIIHQKRASVISKQASSVSTKELFRRLDLIEQLSIDIDHNANKQLAVEQMLISSVA
ncbi:DNA polymerase III subunit delta' [Bdellovibrionota bacterium]